MLRIILTASLLSACSAPLAKLTQDPIEYALEVYGDVSPACEARVRAIEFEVAPLEDVRNRCQNQRALGCVEKYDAVGARALIAEGEGLDTYAHEAMHILLRCEWRQDPGHIHEVWRAPYL